MLESATTTIEVAKAELARRRRDQTIANLPLARAIRDAWKGPHPATKPLRGVARFAHPELRGAKLIANRLSPEEAEELDALIKRRLDLAEGEEMPVGWMERYEQIVGKAAGDEDLFETRRREAAAKEKLAVLKEGRRIEALPKRPVYAEPGSVTLPRFVFSWLDRQGGWTVADVGLLAVILGMFENRTSLFANGTFEDVDGEPVLVIRGGIEDLRLAVGTNGNPQDAAGSGFVRERVALRTLVRNKWLAAEQSPGKLRIRLGERAQKVREGKEPREAKSA